MAEIKVGLCQLDVTRDREHNIKRAFELLREAKQMGADFAILPEMFVCQFHNSNFRPNAQEPNGELVQRIASLAKELDMYIIAGSIPELENDKVYNTSYFIDRKGNILDKHRKAHLFDATLKDGTVCRESKEITPGNKITVVDTEYGKMGLAICFDIRFSEFFRLYGNEDCKVIFHPAAFNLTTGPAHWEISIRMRALDQQCYMVSCAPAQDLSGCYKSYAHSMVAGPSGEIVHEMGLEEGVELATLDLDKIDIDRQVLPITTARRTDLYCTKLV